MDALSTTHPVSSLLPKSFISTNPNNHPLHLLKPPPPSIINHPPPLSTTLSNKANYSHKPFSTPLPTFSPPTPPLKPTFQTHSRAATGYAAALLDVACCDGVLSAVAKDVRRVKRIVEVVLEDEDVEEGKKGEVVRRVVEGAGGFYGKLVVLVRMLVGKGKVGMVREVMEEFGRMWEEMCGIKRVIVLKDKSSSLVYESKSRFAM